MRGRTGGRKGARNVNGLFRYVPRFWYVMFGVWYAYPPME